MDSEEAQWAEQCRRGIARPLRDRIRFGFVKTYRPVLDDAPFRVFNSMAEYRRWCHENLPEFLGFRIQGETGSPANSPPNKPPEHAGG